MARDTTKKVLVIRFSAMGDVAMLTHVLKGLYKAYPSLKITLLSNALFCPIFKGLDNVCFHNVFLKTKHKGIIGMFKLAWELKTEDFEFIADTHSVIRSKILIFFLKILRPRIKVFTIDKGRKEKKALVSPKNKLFSPLKSTHQRYVDVFSEAGYRFDLSLEDTLPKRNVHSKKSPLNHAFQNIGFAPFAAFHGKTYPLTQSIEVIKKLTTIGHYRIFLFGSPADTRKLLSLGFQYENVLVSGDFFSFDEELALISNLDLMISMDSGNVHLAAMFGVPTVTIWGVTHPFSGFEAFGNKNTNLLPNRDKFPKIPTSVYGNVLPKGYESCFYEITPNMIFSKVKAILGSNKAN